MYDLAACHGCVDDELRLKWAVLDQDRCVIHYPLAVCSIIHISVHLELVCYFPVGSSVVDRDHSLALWTNPLQYRHEEAVRGEVEPFGR